ncbi:uncharacterized protein SPPG_05460 [Spizellomyces punctatus DAOM BR117]|uniref:Fork-head domain-containing protein n=1 Tax=Spizellomyces punctatus (strain DAOM BR117) TaxID=645134 RepID=A0A0L0HCD4_SPIPD|nr:uncharacterized protein SPPG_05460 [Spizellomyces punctatus DAOM BR117]KNC99205.1 hypothetical protein SPPG_05460 [Spizellomyces punctatus DAOM BR117]|eukprot:XP_016607245.1 hypothetical protein SPPG_05460 [Spizellomyces punctatus DAOM BR117]
MANIMDLVEITADEPSAAPSPTFPFALPATCVRSRLPSFDMYSVASGSLPSSELSTACSSPVASKPTTKDGFTLLLEAAFLEDKENTVKKHQPPTNDTPPRSPNRCITHGNFEGEITVIGDYTAPVRIGYGPRFTINLGTASQQRPYIVIEWNPFAQRFELRVCGQGTVTVGINTFSQNSHPAVLETFSTFRLDNARFCFLRPNVPSPIVTGRHAGLALPSRSSDIYCPRIAGAVAGCPSYLGLAISGVCMNGSAGSSVLSKTPKVPCPITRTPDPSMEPMDMDRVHMRPNLSWANLIIGAFKSSGKTKLLVSDIYAEIARTHPYYRVRSGKKGHNWRNAVRHALSVNTCFFRLNENEYKGGYWSFSEKTGPTTARRCPMATQRTERQGTVDNMDRKNITSAITNLLPSPLPSPDIDTGSCIHSPFEVSQCTVRAANSNSTSNDSTLPPIMNSLHKLPPLGNALPTLNYLTTIDIDMKNRLEDGTAAASIRKRTSLPSSTNAPKKSRVAVVV